MDRIIDIVLKRVNGFDVKRVELTSQESGASYGRIVLEDGFSIGFIFFEPEHVSLTMSNKDIITQHKKYLEKNDKTITKSN